MAKLHFRPYLPNQTVLFPGRIDENIAANDPVRIVNTVVDNLNLDNFKKLYKAKAKKLIDGGYADKTVVMGIRPDDIDDSQIQIETYGDTVIEADVTGYELLGSEVLLYYTVAGVNMTARVDARTTAKIGDHIRLALDPEKIHVFDKESELTITN